MRKRMRASLASQLVIVQLIMIIAVLVCDALFPPLFLN